MCTTVPFGSVWWAHVPGGAASYQVAPPDWLLPDGADVDEDGLAAGLALVGVATWAGIELGGGDACARASTGTASMAAQSASGTAKRAALDPRVVRTPPLLQNAGTAHPASVLKRTQRRSRTRDEPRGPRLPV